VARTVAYLVALVVGALGGGAVVIVAAVAPEHTLVATAIVSGATSAVATIAGGLGVVYRPTVPAEARRAA